jgi:hypothetical protein
VIAIGAPGLVSGSAPVGTRHEQIEQAGSIGPLRAQRFDLVLFF